VVLGELDDFGVYPSVEIPVEIPERVMLVAIQNYSSHYSILIGENI
jgi:hypothetical protein